MLSLEKSDFVCKVTEAQSYVVLVVVMALVAVVALVILFLNRSFFINKYLACKETMGSKHEYSIYSAKYSSVVV